MLQYDYIILPYLLGWWESRFYSLTICQRLKFLIKVVFVFFPSFNNGSNDNNSPHCFSDSER